MAFTDSEMIEHMKVIEDRFWSRRRPPLHLRDKVREGQRFSGNSIELFFTRPLFDRPGEFVEEPIAKVQRMRRLGVWRIFWQRANGRWNRYPHCPDVYSLAEALLIIDDDAYNCFFG